ncbi:HSP20 family protein [Stackebrandtia endophytica]|uniref:HSP20 family protein n=1 Tax=Stackebrandtia endophytica TaxID=1496996 RepID=A0A543B011_9ACTN|nr:Hsp20/alpha crystallin family protein [Stackebrandtia endophytica]TQL78173.1 HSP20 family protein [Stackebrandtia endophytica]
MLVRYRQPWYLSSRVNSQFDKLISDAFGREATGFTPAADVVTEGNDVVVTLALPGVSAEAIDVTLEGPKLTISGERVESETAEGDRYLSRGLRRGSFTRTFTVPRGTTGDQIHAELENGLLKVRVSEVTKPQAQPEKIAVNSVVTGKAQIEAEDVDSE